MNATYAINREYFSGALHRTEEMKRPFVISIIFHVVVVVVGLVGLPYIKPDIPIVEDSIAVELVTADEIEKAQAPPPRENVRERPPQNLAEEPPKPVQAVKPAEKREIKPIAPVKPIAPPTKKPEVVEKAPPPEETEDTEEAEVQEQQEQFQSVLRNLMPDEADPAPENEEKPETDETSSFLTRFSQQVTADEMVTLRNQLMSCWSIQAGARFAEDLVVPLRISINRDRTVRNVEIVENMRYNTDSFYRAAADSAIRAVWRCNPLDVPEGKYDLWNTMVIRFDPSDML